MHTKEKLKEGLIHCFPLAGRCPATPWEVGPQQRQWLLWKTNAVTRNVPPYPFPHLLLPSMVSYGRYRISLWPVWVTCPGCGPSQSLTHPKPPGFWLGGGGGGKPWHSASTLQQEPKLVSYEPVLASIQSTAGYCGESWPHNLMPERPSTNINGKKIFTVLK